MTSACSSSSLSLRKCSRLWSGRATPFVSDQKGLGSRRLATLTRTEPLTATGAHISLIGHITEDELRARLTRTDTANGFANRFLFPLTRRSKELPFGGNLSDSVIDHFGEQLKRIVDDVTGDVLTTSSPLPPQITMTEVARREWAQVYSALSAERPGLFGAVTARAEAQVVRLALIYALLDRSNQIDLSATSRRGLRSGPTVKHRSSVSSAMRWAMRSRTPSYML